MTHTDIHYKRGEIISGNISFVIATIKQKNVIGYIYFILVERYTTCICIPRFIYKSTQYLTAAYNCVILLLYFGYLCMQISVV